MSVNYFELINLFLQAAPVELALVKSIVDAIHDAHQTGQPAPVFVPVPAGAIPIQVPAMPTPPPPQVAPAVQTVPVALPEVPQAAGSVTVMPDSQPVVVTGVPGQKRDRDLKNVAQPAD